MKKAVFVSSIAASLLTAGVASAAAWDVDSGHAKAQFSIKHLTVANVQGEFSNITGTAEIDDKDLAKSKVDIAIDTTTLNTSNPKRDEHLRSPDFFDVAKYPRMTFTSTKVKKGADGKLKIIGNLTIRGITKETTLEVEELSSPIQDPWGLSRRGAHATGVIHRKDFGMVWNQTLDKGGVAVAEDAKVTIDVELVRPAKS